MPAPLQSTNQSYHGLSGEPSGLYAVTAIPLDWQYLISFSWVRYGWHSTCQHKSTEI